MSRRLFAVLALLALSAVTSPGWTQDSPAQEKKLVFNFKDASIDAVLQYVCREMGWTLVYGTKAEGTITAFSDSEIPESKIVDFLNSALVKAKPKVQVFQFGGVLKLVSEDEAKRGTFNIHLGSDPEQVPINDTIRTWIIPLKNASVADINRELKDVLSADSIAWAVNSHSNSIVVTGKGTAIYRIVRILRIIDVQAPDRLEVRMFKLKNADAQEAAKLLNEVYRMETPGGQQGRGRNPLQQMIGGFFGGMGRGGRGGGGGGGEEDGIQARTLASQTLRITADTRTNSVVAAAVPATLEMIEKLLGQLDGEAVQAIQLKLYPLRYADATSVAQVVTTLFEEGSSQSREANRPQGRFGFMMAAQGGEPAESSGSSRQVRAVADLRSNSVVVAANESNLRIIDDLIANIDRQLTDVLRIRVYELQYADAASMAATLGDIFRPQVNATQSAGRATPQALGGRGSPFSNRFGGNRGANTPGASGLPPSQEIGISSDLRTNSLVVKASEEYLAIVDQIVEQLDRNSASTLDTYMFDLKNADASLVADTIRNLLKGGSSVPSRTSANNPSGQRRQGGGAQQSDNFQRNQQGGASSTRRGGVGGSTRQLGPLQDQDQDEPPMQEPPRQEPPLQEDRRGLSGQVDVQADPATNSLLIRTSPRNLDAVQSLISKMDRMRPQVLIKVLIAEVTLDTETQFGVEGFWENKFRIRGDPIRQRYGTDFNLPAQGFSALLSGDEMQAALNAFAEEGKLKVLATPRVLVLDNETANISVGKEVPRITNSTVNPTTGVPTNSVTYERIGILLDVTPHINPDGLVTLDVHPEISDIAPASESVVITEGASSPTFFVNSADTTVAVRNGQTVVIGGLIRESESETIQKIPLLGDIPLLGFFFSNTATQKVKRELMIFLTPYVAYTSAQLEEVTDLEKAKLKLLDERDIESQGREWLKRLRR
ncbi:MAG: hypothetical protein HY716_15040 [Planctomycetes bacterium]|nr:hypothetical protein [Planctomycetota bacterium]